MGLFYRWICAATCGASLFFAISCNSGGAEKAAFEREPDEKEESRPVIRMAKVTGTTFLTNIKEIGIFNGAGRVTCMAIDKADSNHLIAGTAGGGLWTSANRGRTWAPIDDQLASLSIRSISQNPLQPNTYYASTYTLMQTGPSITSYRPDIYKSTDGGKSFQLIPATAGAFSLVVKVACSPTNAATVYALSNAFSTARGLYRSTDNGATFTQVFTAPSADVTDLELLPNGGVLLSAGNEVYRSPNGNSGTFVPSTSGLNGTSTFNSIDIAFSPSQPSTVWGVTTGGSAGVGVFRSADGGANWTFVQSLASGIFTRAIGVKPDDPGYLFAGSVGLYLTRNNGSSFSFYGVGGVDWWSVNFDPHDDDKVFITFDQGISLVHLNPFNTNNNTAYVKRDSLLNCAQIYAGDYFPVGDKVAIGLQDLSTQVSSAGGSYGLGMGGDGGYTYYHKQDTSIVYGCRQNGDILKKTKAHIIPPTPGFTQPVSILNNLDADNNGSVDEGAAFVQPFWVNSADGEQLYYPTRRRLWRSVNGGGSWQPVSGYYTLPSGGGDIFMEGNGKINPIIYWSVHDTLWVKPSARTAGAGGELKLKMPGSIRFVRVDPSNDSIVYITSGANSTGARIHRSGNLFKPGLTWTDITGDLPAGIYVRCIELNPQNKSQLVAGTSSGLFVSGDGGAHWAKELGVPNVSILRSVLRPSDRRLFLFTYGRGAWAVSFPATSGVAGNPVAEKPLAVWPNPTTGVLHLELAEAQPAATVQVWSAEGRIVHTIGTEGRRRITADIADLPAGAYLIALSSGGQRLGTAKVVKR